MNVSKSGASVLLGARGFHYTIGPKGTRVTAGLPGTGLSWSQYTPHARASARVPLIHDPSEEFGPHTPSPIYLNEPALVPIQNAPAERINALSTSELAPILNSAHRRMRLSPFVFFICSCLLLIAMSSADQAIIGLVALYTTIFIPLSIFLDRYRRSVKIEYELDGAADTIASALAESFADLKGCNSIWSICAEGYTADWKRHAGATGLTKLNFPLWRLQPIDPAGFCSGRGVFTGYSDLD
jgi:hypothetical protein